MNTPLETRSKQFVLWIAVFLLGAGGSFASAQTTLSLRSAVPPIPCSARANGVIANSGNVDSLRGSLVDSYRSALGTYIPANSGSQGGVRAATTIGRLGGIIHGSATSDSPAGLPLIKVPPYAQPLPLNAKLPGSVSIRSQAESITLDPGTYVAEDIDVESPGVINVRPGGLVSIFLTGKLILNGDANPHGSPANLQFIVANEGAVQVGQHGSLVGLLYAPRSVVDVRAEVFGSVVGATVHLEAGSAIHFDESSACPSGPSGLPAVPPAALPSPPAKVGCHEYTDKGWHEIACATKESIESHFAPPDAQPALTSTATMPLVFGQLEVTLLVFGAESNAFLASTASIPGCQHTGSPSSNQFSVQNNTNAWPITSGSHKGHFAQTQFTIQSMGPTNLMCIWNVDDTAQDYSNTQCVESVMLVGQRALQPSDFGNVAASINSNGTLSMVASLSWLSGGPKTFAVTSDDTFGLAGNWFSLGGGILGLGLCSQAQFSDTEVLTQIQASTCQGDTQQNSPVCANAAFAPNATASIGSEGTVETSNLMPVAQPAVTFLNSDLAVTSLEAISPMQVSTAPDALILYPADQSAGKFFVGTAAGRLFENYWDETNKVWGWTDHGAPPGTAVSTAPGALIIYPGDQSAGKFFMGTTNGHLFENYWDETNKVWGWTDHGAPPGTAVSTAPGALIIYPGDQSAGKFFMGTTNGHLFENYWDETNKVWGWTDHGAPPGTAVSTAPGALIIYPGDQSAGKFFMGTTNGHLFENYWDETNKVWGWTDHGAPPGTAVSTAPGALIIYPGDQSAGKFFMGTKNGHLFENYWDETNKVWGWTDHGAPPGTAVSTAPGALIIYPGDQSAGKFFMGTKNGHLFENYWDETNKVWGWTDHGAPPGTAVSTAPGALIIYPGDQSAGKFFMGTTNGHLFENYWDETNKVWGWTDHGLAIQ